MAIKGVMGTGAHLNIKTRAMDKIMNHKKHLKTNLKIRLIILPNFY
jgi:hypothetical protein